MNEQEYQAKIEKQEIRYKSCLSPGFAVRGSRHHPQQVESVLQLCHHHDVHGYC